MYEKRCRLSLLLALSLMLAMPQVATRSSAAVLEHSQADDVAAVERGQENATDERTREEEELAPAAVAMDVSQTTPLIQALYRATRETKERAIMDRIAEAQKLIDGGADLKGVDAQGRTALHWAVFGSSYANKAKVLVAYERLASAMIQRGVEINRQDIYQDTPLDYLLYSPNFEMQTLLIENGATSGFLAAVGRFSDEGNEGIPQIESVRGGADLAPGATFRIQLRTPVYSDHSRTGDPVAAWVMEPVYNGGRLMIAPSTVINGTILFAQKASSKYDRPRLALDFSNLEHPNGKTSPVYLRVLDVDNARETVRNNEIIGIVQPHAPSKASLITAVAGAINPIAGYALKGAQAVYGLSLRREIFFPEGADMLVQVVRPSMIKEKPAWPGWAELTMAPELKALVAKAPFRTATSKGTPSDLANLLFIGAEKDLLSAFEKAGWYESDKVGLITGLQTIEATVRQAGYASAPVSLLTLAGRAPDHVFQKGLDTFAKRHHIRIWKLSDTYEGKEVWIGAGTRDIAISTSGAGTKWSHRIDPHVDREREWIRTDLLYNDMASGYAYIERPDVPKTTSNATGDEILTDGRLLVLQLGQPLPTRSEK